MNKGMIAVVSTLVGAMAGVAAATKVNIGMIERNREMSDKHLIILRAFNEWMITKQNGKHIVDYFHKKEIKTVAIYGMSFLGERLYDELKGTDIEVKYAIDKNATNIFSEIDILLPDEELPEVDAVIVTPIFFFTEIESNLAPKTQAKIIPLDDILYEIQL